MAVNRETIEIQLAGADRVRNLTRDLNAAQVAAASLSDQLEETTEQLQALGIEQRTFNANTRIIGGQRRLVRGAQRDPGFTAGLSRAEATAIREDLRLRAESINQQLRGRALEGRALQNRIRFARQLEGRERAALAENQGLNNRLVRARDAQIGLIQDGNQLLRRELRSSRSQSRQRITATRRSRYEQTITRIGGEAELGAGSQRRIAELRQRERRVSQQLETLDEAVAASRRSTLVQRESLAEQRFSARSGFAGELRDLRASLRAGGSLAGFNAGRGDVRLRVQESESNFAEAAQRITQASDANERAFESTRRSLTVELGSIAEGIREVLRTDKGIKRGADTERRLSERLRELVRSGATQGTTAGGRIIAPSTVEDVERRLSRASGFRARGDIEASNRLLSSAERTISAAERELNLRKKITRENEAQSKSAVSLNKQREKALDTENDRTIKLQGLQRKLNELRADGVVGPGLQRAQSLIGRLPGLEQEGNLQEFDRVAKRASSALLDVASASKLQTRASKDVATAEKRRAAATRKGEDLEFKLRELTAAGVDPRQLAASVGGKPAQLQKILGRAFSEASFGDPEKAAELLDIAGRRVTVLERELGLSKQIASEEEKRLKAGRQGFPSSPVRGGKEMPGSPAWQAQNFDKPGVAQMRLNKALNSGDVLLKKLETLRMKGVDTVQEELNLQNNLNTARNSGFQLSKGNLSILENAIKNAELFVSTEQKLTTELEKQFKLRKMAAGGSGPIRRDTLTGRLATFGDLELAGRMQLGGRGTESAINQIVKTFNRTIGAGAQGGKVGQQLGLNDLAKVSKASARELELLVETLSMVRAGMRSTDKGFDQIGDTIARVNRQIQRQDPDADFLTRRLGVRGGRAASEGLIGGAFPLLFGQGVGAAAGGALGGGLGGFAGGMLGFGLSLAGTAIGSAIDDVMQAAQDTGEMLRDLTGNFDQIKEAGLLASRDQEKLVQSLLEAGNKTAAYSIIQAELNSKLGVDGVSKLRAAADAGDRMQRAMAELGLQLQVFVAGPLAEFLEAVANALGARGQTDRYARLLKELPADRAQELRQAALGAVTQAGQANPLRLRTSLFGTQNLEPDEGEIGRLAAAGGLSGILKRFEAFVPTKPPTEEERRSAATKEAETALAGAQRDLQVASKELESIDLLKGFQQQLIAVRREQEDIDRQSFEIRRDYERQIADIRENVENKVLQINQDNRRKEIEIIGKQGELRQAQIRLLGLELQGALAGDELAAGLADAVTTYLSAQLSAQDQIEQRRLQFELEISNQQIEVEKFKTDIAKNVSQLNLSTAERIESINFGIARRNEDAARNNFETEKKIAGLKISASKRELFLEKNNVNTQLVLARANASLQPQNEIAQVLVTTLEGQVKEIDKAMSEIEDLRKRIEASPAPQPIRSVAPLGAKGVSTAGIDAAANQNRRLLGQARDLLDAITRVNQGGDLQQFFNTLDNLVLGSSQRLESEFKASWDELRITLGETGIAAERLDNSFDKFFADFEARNEALRKAGKPFEQLSESQKALINGYRGVAKELAELEQTQKFYTESQQSLNERYTQARDGIKELLGPTTEYEKLLRRFEASGGLGVDAKKRQELLNAARAVDALNEDLRALNALNELAGGLTDSFIQFNKELLTGKNLAKSLTQFLESAAERSIDVFLEYTLRPIQEKMFKDLAKFLGFDLKEDPALRELKFIGGEATAIRLAVERLEGLKDALRPATPVPAPAPANGIVPGPGAIPNSKQFDTIRTPSGYEPTNKSHTDYPQYGRWVGSPQSSIRGFNGVGGPDLPLAIERVPGIKQKDVERALELYGKTEDQFIRRLSEMRTVAEVENYKSDILEIITKPDFPAEFPADQAGPIRTDMAATLDRLTIERLSELAAKAQTAGIAIDRVTASANGAAKGLGEVAGSGAAAAETQAAAANKTESAVEQQNQFFKKFGQVAGASIQTLSGVAMAVGGAQMIGKGGTYNTLMGIAGIFGGISSVASGISGFGKAFGGPAGGSIAPGPVAQRAGVQYRPGFYGPAFAKGGRPDPYKPAWVGEEGMELWVPDRPGTIISNDNLDNVYIPGLDDEDGASLQVGRYSGRSAGGPSDSTWDDDDGQAMPYTRSRVAQGRQQSSSNSYGRSVPYQRSETTREIDRLERVAANPRELPPIKYETQRVNTYEFVTPQQLEESNARTAKTARAQTIRELTDSLKTRKRIGL